MINNNTHLTELKSPKQSIQARVEIYSGSTLAATCTCADVLQDFSVEKTGEGKFFGYGICQKLTTNLIDVNRALKVTPEHSMKAAFGVSSNFIYPFPTFYIDTVERDETSNGISVTAYDALYDAAMFTFGELALTAPYTVKDVADACASLLGVTVETNITDQSFNTSYDEGANFGGSENIREVLNYIAEVTQTVYYLNNNEKLVFKRLDAAGAALLTLEKDNYFSFKSGEIFTLANICSATELGNNFISGSERAGVIQYVRDNPFWDNREDTQALVDSAEAAVGGLAICAFNSEWSGNYLLEIGDKIQLRAEDNSLITTFLLSDVLTYDGTLMESSAWEFGADEAEGADKPTSLGDALNQTFAKVDRVNKEVNIQASRVDAHESSIAALQVNTDNVNISITKVRTDLEGSLASTNTTVAHLSGAVESKVDGEQLQEEIEGVKREGVEKVVTATTNYTFDDNGLNISKSNSDISTKITEDGMQIYQNEEEVLTANNQGVNAKNLHATTWLIIGKNSRFEDMGDTRTGCFWIGGQE